MLEVSACLSKQSPLKLHSNIMSETMRKIIYKTLAYAFYKHAEKIRPLAEKRINFKALNLPDDYPIILKLHPLDQGFSHEFSLYGFREALNSFFVYWLIRRFRPHVIDVGANLGYYVGIEVAAGAQKVVAVEPSPPTFRYLKESFGSFPNVDLLNVAVSDRDQEVYFQVSKALNLSSVIDHPLKHEGSVIKVKAYSLQTLIRMLKLNGRQNLVLRMDVEGYEQKILNRIPSEVKWIDVELHPGKYNVGKFIKKVTEQGFNVKYFISDVPFGFYPIINSIGLKKALKILNSFFKDLIIVEENVNFNEIKSLLRKSVHPYIIFQRV